ncbi:Predicted tubulin-tyrosine ligase [Phaffia rhodozyma]|uniref:Predicted tubulin-tyrosine ligase n=1 Tax=Phaffia rhodozyma TaxID=264483 RepID=A0A0F7SS09_PHARH|nr:Predicted tubulin-tyrosine ligase [Phaffia rhodozyma]
MSDETALSDQIQAVSLQKEKTPLQAFISFPSPYTQTLILTSLASNLTHLNILPSLPTTPAYPLLCWADYDVLPHELIQSTSASAEPLLLSSSYIYRKSLIRKHYLHSSIQEYLGKYDHWVSLGKVKGDTPLRAATPRGWRMELQFADELDELFADDLYDLLELMDQGENRQASGEGERNWFILKPGMSDRGMGIRIFSTRAELEEIFEEMEDDSDDEDEDEGEDGDEDNEENEGGKVATSQLRHFVIQEYLPNPVLLTPLPAATTDLPLAPANRKFHLRTYVLLSSAYTVHLSRTTLALFSSLPYSPPETTEESLLPHLTNTCLQPPQSPGEVNEENVHLWWELEGRQFDEGKSVLTKELLDFTWERCGEVAGEAIRAAVECGSVHMQLLPNCFEIFGVDFLLTLPSSSSPSTDLPQVHILEFNASPDFHQSGERLQSKIREMFDGVVDGFVKPFFGIDDDSDDEENEDKESSAEIKWDGQWEQGMERAGWKCFTKGEIRRGW